MARVTITIEDLPGGRVGCEVNWGDLGDDAHRSDVPPTPAQKFAGIARSLLQQLAGAVGTVDAG